MMQNATAMNANIITKHHHQHDGESMTITISQINIYPVKGLGGFSLPSSELTTRGLAHDRRFMIVDHDHQFVSQREIPKMATVWTEIIGGTLELSAPDCESIGVDAEPRAKPTRTVQIWSSRVHAHTVSAEADEWLSSYLGFDARLVYMPDSSMRRCSPAYAKNNEIVSFADGYPVLLANEASLADLNQRISKSGGNAVPMNRFRANIVMTGAAAWAEDTWQDFSVGLDKNAAILRNVKPCARCQVTTTDQASGEVVGPEPLKTLATFRDSVGGKGIMFGANLVPVRLGKISVGDALTKI
jgi:uncharacterized protein